MSNGSRMLGFALLWGLFVILVAYLIVALTSR